MNRRIGKKNTTEQLRKQRMERFAQSGQTSEQDAAKMAQMEEVIVLTNSVIGVLLEKHLGGTAYVSVDEITHMLDHRKVNVKADDHGFMLSVGDAE